MLDISGMTQEQIEQAFSRESIVETLAVGCDIFYTQMDDSDIAIAQKIIGVDDVYEFMVHFIAILGDPSRDLQGGKTIHHRQLEAEALIKAISTNKQLASVCHDYEERLNMSMDLVAEYDTILYDLAYKQIRTDDGDFYTMTVANVEFSISLKDAILPKFQGFPLPLIETPKDWIEGESGGYWSSEKKCTLNKGEANQPQNVLDVLNTLQHNQYIMAEHTNVNDHYNFVLDKMLKEYDIRKAKEIALNIASTAELVYETMRDIPFYLEWRYDFRGRINSTGYDLNLQSDKYHKGAIIPMNKGI